MASIALADDHILIRNALAELLKKTGHTILFEADNGRDLIDNLNPKNLPDVALMDINMPVMDGFETTQWLRTQQPTIKVLALSMYNNEGSIIKMFKAGARGYILKDCKPQQLEDAIKALMKDGFYYSDMVNGKLINAINKLGENENDSGHTLILLNEKEKEMLRFFCTEFTYKEIAEQLAISPRTVDSYRDILFEKINVKTRIGLAMYAVRTGIVKV